MHCAIKVPSGISPARDQHAGYEINSRGKRICERGGFASDFFVPGLNSLAVAKWVLENTPFDRLYFYGQDRPIHVSVNEDPVGQVVTMTTISRNGNRVPRVIAKHRFLELPDD